MRSVCCARNTMQQLEMKNIFEKIADSRKTGEIEFFIKERNKDCVIGIMPVKEGILNPFGTVQAGAMLWLADVTATVLALQNVELGPDGKGFPLAINLNTSLLGNQRRGEIRAEARFVRSGKKITVIRTRVTGNQGRLLAEVTTTHVPAV
jgi:1,4-dihydroxy-2-naphthoyl-CoA hydrolase